MKVTFILNGKQASIQTEPNRRLLDILREDLCLTGTKEGCSIGECGACTVIVDGKAVNSCLILAPQVEGAKVITIEGLSQGNSLHILQESFLKSGAVQCGFCTPGMILSAFALLSENSNPTEQEINVAISGNLCRCTGYKQIVDAVQMAAAQMKTDIR